MDIDIILEPDVNPSQVAELAVKAEKLGVRALWTANYHQQWDAFLSLAPAALATSKILLGPLAITPWEMHPLKMTNAILTLNEMSQGRAIIGISGGGGVLAAMGWRAREDGAPWPSPRDDGGRYPDRPVRGVREALEVIKIARSRKFSMGYPGGVFDINRPFIMNWAESSGPMIYSCACRPQMIRMSARVADGIQFSDFTPEMLPAVMENVATGFGKRDDGLDKLRIGNFWAWHIKKDREKSMYEARRELVLRLPLIAKIREQIAVHCQDDSEVDLILDNWDNFFKAWWSKSGTVENVPLELVHRLVGGMASAGGLDAIDQEVERFRQFEINGLTEISIRLHDDPMDGLKIIGKHIIPALNKKN